MNRLTPSNYLRILELAHYIMGILVVPYFFFSLYITIFPLFGVFAWGLFPGVFWSSILLIIVIAVPLSFTTCILLSARYISQRSNYTFTVVIACLECFISQYGSWLGLITLILFSRPSIKSLYNLD